MLSSFAIIPPIEDKVYDYLKDLNEPQRQAVEKLEGSVLVLAGAGTGKTRVLTTRVAHILMLTKAWPSQILAVTFTNKASHEMRARIAHLIGNSAEGLWLGTFHALSVRILRSHAELAGLKSNFTILDADDQVRLVKQILKAENIDEKRWPPRLIQTIISRWKDRGYLPHKVPEYELSQDSANPALTVYKIYQERLKTLNAVDFGDLLLHCITIFSAHSDVLKRYQQQFRYVMVDEYQDTNVAQYLWLRLLAMGHNNICCVGDDDQSIYGWRGAEVANILRFEKDFPDAVVIRLEQNYRSTPEILGAAAALIAHNKDRLGKTLWTTQETGEKISLYGLWDGESEARFVGEEIERWQRAKESLASIAILVRAGHQTREFEDRLITLAIPYRVIGGPKFYERMEVRDALAYLRLIVQPEDSLSFERIINTPRRGIGNSTLQILNQFARLEQISLVHATGKLLGTDELKGAAKNSLRSFLTDLERWQRCLQTMTPAELAQTVLDESGYTQMWMQDKSVEAPGRLENLKELVSALDEFQSLGDFLEHVSLVMDNNSAAQSEAVSIMTLHSAKGLEFNTVFLAGWEEGIFPNARSLDAEAREGLEEERRLAYVGLTRARKRVYISFVANRRLHGLWQSSLPSRFIDELPKDLVDIHTQPGLFARRPYGEEEQRIKKPLHLSSSAPSPASRHRALYQVRDRVFHLKFGYGQVVEVMGDKLEVDFEHSGLKKVMTSFVEKK